MTARADLLERCLRLEAEVIRLKKAQRAMIAVARWVKEGTIMDRIKMADIKCGDLFWECEGGENAQFEAMQDACIRGDTVTLQGRDVDTGLPQAFMLRLSAPQYGPRLYRTPQYARPR